MDRYFLKPAEGRTVRSPQHGGQPLDRAGRWLDPSAYWQRRLDDGDVVDDTKAQIEREAEAATAAAEAAEAAAKAEAEAAKITAKTETEAAKVTPKTPVKTEQKDA